MLDDLIKAREEKTVWHKKGILPNTPQWIDFFNLMTKKYHRPFENIWTPHLMTNKLENGEMGGTDIMIYGKMDPVIFKAVQYADGNYGDNFIDASPMIDLLSPVFPRFEIKAILNLVGGESEYWAHKDDHEVVSWGCQGTMEWRIYPNLKDDNIDQIKVKDEHYDSYILEPGDLIYVPTGIGHQVVTPEPRASLILQANQIQHECSDECRASHK